MLLLIFTKIFVGDARRQNRTEFKDREKRKEENEKRKKQQKRKENKNKKRKFEKEVKRLINQEGICH